MKRNLLKLFTKKRDPLLDLDGLPYTPQSNKTFYLKDASATCPKCGGPCGVWGDTNSYGVLERLYLKCPKCGEGYVLTSKQPDSHEETQALIKKGVLR